MGSAVVTALTPGESELSLALLMLCNFADHAHNTLAVNDLALVANLLDACTNLHCFLVTSTG